MPDAIDAMTGHEVVPMQITDIGEQVNPVMGCNPTRQLHHLLLGREHLQPSAAADPKAPLGAPGHQALNQTRPIHAPGFVFIDCNVLQGILQIQPRGAMVDQKVEPGLRMNRDDHPADVEDNIADQVGITVPSSPAVIFTDTTVARGKKLNSEALAQV